MLIDSLSGFVCFHGYGSLPKHVWLEFLGSLMDRRLFLFPFQRLAPESRLLLLPRLALRVRLFLASRLIRLVALLPILKALLELAIEHSQV